VSRAGRKLFQDFSLRILPGENWVITGDNGSGKTLLLHLIAGTVHPSSGEVVHSFIQQGDWDHLYRQRAEKIHFVPTHWLSELVGSADGLFYQQRYYSVDNTRLPTARDAFGGDVEKLKALDFSERFDISGLLDVELTRLSNGQLKKVVILRQLVRNLPSLLLLDYPFDGLDAESQRDLSAFLDDISQRFSIQLILVDHGHSLPAVMNRKLHLHNFQIAASGEWEQAPAPVKYSPAKETPSRAVTNGSPVVEMQDLTIKYGNKTILANLNWRINAGERWALTGRNGSGKTTLFSLIYADHPMAYSQRVFLFGRRRGSGESIWDIKKRINYFGPEQIHFLDSKNLHLSGREYIRLQRKDPQRTNDLIEFFNAHAFADTPLRNLSSGQLQLVLLMNVFLDDKELLLLDEPFQYLDPATHERVTRYLNRYLREDITLVLITHDENDVRTWTQLRKRL
ncbi:MAG TPA: ATP-binding cassette domain-containing protein, partial [Chryseosolibacter sp.]